ncbi:hypothetical protein DQ238_10685 [Geodermatophilus sp. TF02-6]|uniref:hypothetical protein n=1 Tax=Geodermatophilus sp. TF02-6 TaxID=2250575 RepID=UPI000DE8E2B7|nr:hypothetical protein [Geodermatophilus sp. TF02-6]RBY78867.1 hypothetical protein DQ238_10685 [Geodermatophilus sp. TF02-6]
MFLLPATVIARGSWRCGTASPSTPISGADRVVDQRRLEGVVQRRGATAVIAGHDGREARESAGGRPEGDGDPMTESAPHRPESELRPSAGEPDAEAADRPSATTAEPDRDTGEVPGKQVHRWKDDGGAVISDG